jgi:hypothetical protein
MPLQSIRIRGAEDVSPEDRRRRPATVSALRSSHVSNLWLTTEQKLIRAYLALQVAGAADDGLRVIPLARFGAYEVRLCEPTDEVVDTFPVWLELYCHRRRTTLDACGRDALDAAVAAADAFIERAKMLHLDGTPEASSRQALADRIVRALRDAGLDCRLATSGRG